MLFMLLVLAAAQFPLVWAASCGDNTCDEGENKCTCPDDCGQCTGSYGGNSCQQFTCISEVCIPILKLGCCGNGICESNEAYSSCPTDCFPRSVAVDMLEFPDGNVLRGQEIILQAKVLADLYPAKDADVKAKSPRFFGTVTLHDDGDHNDLEASDGVYGDAIVIGPNAPEGEHKVEVEAFVRTVRGETDFMITLAPYLSLNASLDAATYALGDNVVITGSLSRLGAPFLAPISLELVRDGKAFFSTIINPDEEGNFVYAHRTSLLDAAGDWTLQLKANDTSNNTGYFERTFRMASEKGLDFLKPEFLEPTQHVYDRSTEIPFILRVLDQHNQIVENAAVEILLPNKQKIAAEELSPGNYGAKYMVPIDFPVGDQTITARAVKDFNAAQYSGTAAKNVVINKIPLVIELLSPAKSTYSLGEKIEFVIKAYYSFNRPVERAAVLLDFGNKILGAKQEPDGAYHYSMTVTEKGTKFVDAKIKVTDAFGNTASTNLSLKIKQDYSLPYLISQNPLQFGGAAAFASVMLAFLAYFVSNAARLRMEETTKRRLTESKKKVQEQYFNERLIGNQEYQQLTEKINAELDQAEARINALRQDSLIEKAKGLLKKKE